VYIDLFFPNDRFLIHDQDHHRTLITTREIIVNLEKKKKIREGGRVLGGALKHTG